MVEKYKAVITDILIVNKVTRIYKFSGLEGFNFVPGQFVMGTIDGLVTSKGAPLKRAYSIASAPKQKIFELCIECKHLGGFTEKIFSLKKGDTVHLEGPFGKFLLQDDIGRNAVLLAAGVGIAPFMSMIRYWIEKKGSGDLLLLYSCRELDDFSYHDELSKYNNNGNLRLVEFLTSKKNVKFSGERGRIDHAGIKKYIKSIDSEFYICGGNAFNKSMKESLLAIGVDKDKIHKEAFF